MKILLGLSGKPRHGKTCAAEAIRRVFPATEVLSISELICAELGIKRELVREVSILQRHSHARTNQDELYWAKLIQRRAERTEAPVVVLANVRRWGEAFFFRGLGWALARVIALNPDGSLYTGLEVSPAGTWRLDRNPNDPLETALDHFNWDYRLIARKPGGKEWLEAQAVALVKYLLELAV